MSEKFTEMEVTGAIHKVVDERGRDYVYRDPQGRTPNDSSEACKYKLYDKDKGWYPACIVGAVVYELDKWCFELLEENHSVTDQPEAILSKFTDTALRALYEAQEVQDSGYTWGDALDAYHVELNGLFLDD